MRVVALTNFSLRFAEGRSGWLFLAAMAGAVGLVYYFYLAHLRPAMAEPSGAGETRVSPRMARALMALRSGVMVVLVLFLFRPVVSFERRTSPRSMLAVAVDRSRSMAARDFEGLPDRYTRAVSALSSSGRGALSDLERDFVTRLFVFDGAATPVGDEGELFDRKPEGETTDLVAAVRGCVESCRAEGPVDLAGVVLLTDGIHTGDAKTAAEAAEAVDPATALGELGLSVHTVGVGSARVADGSFRDVRISAVRTPSAAPVNNAARIRVLVEAQGFAGRVVPVRILEDTPEGPVEIARANVTLDDTVGDQEVVLTITPEEMGQREYRATLAADPGENVHWNNERAFFLNVTDPRLRVLYLEGAARAEFKHLRRLMERDPQMEAVAFIKVKRGVFRRLGHVADIDLKEFPRTREEVEPFNVFIIGDLDATHFAHGELAEIARAVREDGKGLLMIQGAASFGAGGYGGTPLAPLLPVGIGSRDEPVKSGEFAAALTPEGASHPVFEGLADLFARKALRPFQVMNLVGRSKSPDAVVLAVRSDVMVDGSPAVVIAAGRAGSGRAMVVTAGPTWPWVFAAPKGLGETAGAHSRLWGQAIRFLAGQEEAKGSQEITLRLDRGEAVYDPGEAVTLHARVRGAEGEAVVGAEVEAKVDATGLRRAEAASAAQAGGDAQPVRAQPVSVRLSPSGRAGEYEATFTPSLTGRHEIAVSASAAGTVVGEAGIKFEVERPSLEAERYDLDARTLEAIATATGGRYVPLEELDRLVSSLRSRQSTMRSPVSLDFGARPSLVFFFFALVALAGAEWYLRRRMQMA